MKLLLSVIMFLFAVTALAFTTVDVRMDITIDPAILGSPIVHLIVFDGPGVKEISVFSATVKTEIINNWCIGPAVPLGDDLAILIFPQKAGTHTVVLRLNPFSSDLKAWIVGADAPTMGQYFTISSNGGIVTKKAPPTPGLDIRPATMLAVHPVGKLPTAWGKMRK